ncbi:MAG: iron-sulfur cluster assembly accessory protein [Pseudomonadota bacterium]
MIKFTDKAKEKILSFMGDKSKNSVLRVGISGRNLNGFSYQFFLEGEKDQRPNDAVYDMGSFQVRTDSENTKDLEGASVDWAEDSSGSGFKVENPNSPMPHLNTEQARKIQDFLDAEINPSLASHGGGADLVDLRDNKAYLKMGGGCQGCGMANATLKTGIEARLREAFPELAGVVDVTDHAHGENPYFK